ncbi:class I SAM-dependent methyltransferase [Cryobacterium roopkundense]|uniref:Ubiquinone/menaquinone biosynthesis C-methylase UbiE n=1 Tax=Cryobacterium roopkundense TaxID=1001240 RepID=A0A7W8ZY32_9MICO|nr:class I SAM-dependent methyltransferase [Cryobacterium roopkundense]MBB5642271.1 ubiquinone/menaquinone biosynthesis C-methylase UbiE [Cryobacterium roopkundense]
MKSAQAADMSARVAALFNRVADTYDAVGVPWFGPIAERLVAELEPRPGERALDLGTGRGAALWPLAAAVGPTGHVTAIDLAEQMIAATHVDAAALGLDTVTLLVADASNPGLAQEFDLAVALLVLFFLPDPASALRAWRGLLVPGCRLGVSTFGPRDAAWESVDAVFTPYLPKQLLDARTSGTRGPFATDAGVEGLLTNAGFAHTRTTHISQPAHFDDVDQWHRWSMSHGQRSHWLAVPEPARADVLALAAERLEAARDPLGGFTLTQRVRFTVGTRPALSRHSSERRALV